MRPIDLFCSNTNCYLFVSFNYVLMRAIHLPDTKKPADLNATLSIIWFKSCVKAISYLKWRAVIIQLMTFL